MTTAESTKQRVRIGADQIATLLAHLLKGASCTKIRTGVSMPVGDPEIVQAKITADATRDDATIQLQCLICTSAFELKPMIGDAINILAIDRTDMRNQGAAITNLGKSAGIGADGPPQYELEQSIFDHALSDAIEKMRQERRRRG